MRTMNKKVSLFEILLVLCGLAGVSGVREKRVIHGMPLTGRGTTYSVVQYYARLGKLSSSGRHHAGGALITPRIVQTACHVLSNPESNRVKGKPFSRPVVMNPWADRLFVYVGYNDMDDPNHRAIGTSKYYIHPKCGRIIQGEWEIEYWVIHDYGWVYLSENVDFLLERGVYKNSYIQYAPQYTVKDLGHYYNYVTSTRAVCLTVGYGNTKWDDDTCCLDDLSSASKVLRHGWNVIFDYETCFHLSRAWYKNPNWYYEPVVYQDVATWICSAGLPQDGNKTRQQSHGDSGSPVTCNNAYVSVVSGGQHENLYNGVFTPAIPYLQIQGAVAFAPFENSYEFRIPFEAFMSCGCYGPHVDKGWEVTFRPWRGILSDSPNPHSLAPREPISRTWSLAIILFIQLCQQFQ